MITTDYLEFFIIGLLGSGHCIGMCGGFVAMYSLRRPAGLPAILPHALYNSGRIATYVLLGGVFGLAGGFVETFGRVRGLHGAALLIAGVLMIFMGLNMSGVLGREAGVNFELTSAPLFRRALRRILSVESVWAVFLLGLLLGLVPCTLVYSMELNAAVSGGPASGMLAMLAFGLGTAPALAGFGFTVTKLRPGFRLMLYRAAAILILLNGLQTFMMGLSFSGWIPPGRFW